MNQRGERPVALLVVAATVAFAADQLTKAWALQRLADGDIGLVFDWRLHLVRNPAAAFSLGGGMGPLIGVLAFAVVIALVVMTRDYVGRFPTICVGIVVGGALGNIADRAFRSSDGFFGGEVIDFVDLRFWPVFNVADSCVVLGVIGLAAHATFAHPPPPDDQVSTEGAADEPPGPVGDQPVAPADEPAHDDGSS